MLFILSLIVFEPRDPITIKTSFLLSDKPNSFLSASLDDIAFSLQGFPVYINFLSFIFSSRLLNDTKTLSAYLLANLLVIPKDEFCS